MLLLSCDCLSQPTFIIANLFLTTKLMLSKYVGKYSVPLK